MPHSFFENRIGLSPSIEAGFRGILKFFQAAKVEIVGRQPPRQFPDPLHRRELRAVWWQKPEFEILPMSVPVRLQELGVVVPGVVQHH